MIKIYALAVVKPSDVHLYHDNGQIFIYVNPAQAAKKAHKVKTKVSVVRCELNLTEGTIIG